MRYYYTDLIHVAYMAKKFGMGFSNIHSGAYFDCPLHRDDRLVDDNDDKYYIHPDSLHILEPREGDLISINGGLSANIVTHAEFLDEIKLMEPQFAAPLKIIQRNNQPFFWPESEA